MGTKRNIAIIGVLALLGANGAVWPYVLADDQLSVTFFDVGQGDAIFIETPQGHRMLIDGGPNNAVVEKVSRELPFWSKKLDLVILTHPDADHVTGLVGVLEAFQVENVLWAGTKADSNIFRAWEAALEASGGQTFLASAPQTITWGAEGHAFMEILYPAAVDIAEASGPNDASVVANLWYGGHTFLFTGDIERGVELELVGRSIPLESTVLKVPHHGSKTSSSELFLAAVNPQMAVIQVGRENRYGHPNEEVLERLSWFAPAVLRNDQLSDIVIQTDGDDLWIQ